VAKLVWHVSNEEDVSENAERPDVTLGIVRPTLADFGCNVKGRTTKRVCVAHRRVEQRAQAKVGEPSKARRDRSMQSVCEHSFDNDTDFTINWKNTEVY